MQPLDLTQGFAIPAGIESPAAQAPAADGGETFAAMVQGLLGASVGPDAADATDDEAAEPPSPDPDFTAAVDPVDLSVLLSLVAPVPVLHQVPVVQPTPDIPVAAGDGPEAITAAAGSHRPRSVDLPTEPVPLDGRRLAERPNVYELPYSPSQGPAPVSAGSTAGDALVPSVITPRGATQGVTSIRTNVPPEGSSASGAVPAPPAAAAAVGSDAPSATPAEGDPVMTSGTEMPPSAGAPAGDAPTIDDAAPRASKAPASAPTRTRGAMPRSGMSADAATLEALATVATVAETLEASAMSPAPPSSPHVGAPAETVAVPATPVRALARDLARLASTFTATPVVAAATATGPGTDRPGQEARQESNQNAGMRGGGAPVAAPVVADLGWVAQASTPVGVASAEGILMPSSSVETGVPAVLVPAVPTPGASVGEVGLGVVTPSRASQIEALLGAGDPDRQNLHSIVRTIRVTGSVDGVSEARLRLQPEHLGQVALNVRVEQGSVTAHFHAESPEARQWIESHQHELRSALRQQGLEVKELVVSTDPDRRQQGRQDEPRERPRQRPRRDQPAAWDAPRFEVTV